MANFGLRAEAKEFPCPRVKESTEAKLAEPASTNKDNTSVSSKSTGGKLRADAQVFHPTYEQQQYANTLYVEPDNERLSSLYAPGHAQYSANFEHTSDRIDDIELNLGNEQQIISQVFRRNGGSNGVKFEDYGRTGFAPLGATKGVHQQSLGYGDSNLAFLSSSPMSSSVGRLSRHNLPTEFPDNSGFDSEAKIWAYKDPKGRPHMGFSSTHMRQWYSAGYFDARSSNLDAKGQWDLTLALLPPSAVGRELSVRQEKELEPHLAWYSVRELYPRGTRPFRDRPVLDRPVIG